MGPRKWERAKGAFTSLEDMERYTADWKLAIQRLKEVVQRLPVGENRIRGKVYLISYKGETR